jgi:hypothetical protein
VIDTECIVASSEYLAVATSRYELGERLPLYVVVERTREPSEKLHQDSSLLGSVCVCTMYVTYNEIMYRFELL